MFLNSPLNELSIVPICLLTPVTNCLTSVSIGNPVSVCVCVSQLSWLRMDYWGEIHHRLRAVLPPTRHTSADTQVFAAAIVNTYITTMKMNHPEKKCKFQQKMAQSIFTQNALFKIYISSHGIEWNQWNGASHIPSECVERPLRVHGKNIRLHLCYVRCIYTGNNYICTHTLVQTAYSLIQFNLR